jgi:hypothetical protein
VSPFARAVGCRPASLALAVLAVGCSADPIVGSWTADGKTFLFERDGTIRAPARSQPDCTDQPAIDACGRKHRWERSGSSYLITFMTLAPPRPTGSSFDSQEHSGCTCVVDISATADLQGSELLFDGGKQRATRVK